ncbi:MAG: cyclase, partial [Acidobacteria bacterium]
MLPAIVAVGSRTIDSQTRGSTDHSVTTAQYERWKKDLSNWGRWGKDDEIGTMNLITPAKRKQAAALVKEGVSVSLASDPDTE